MTKPTSKDLLLSKPPIARRNLTKENEELREQIKLLNFRIIQRNKIISRLRSKVIKVQDRHINLAAHTFQLTSNNHRLSKRIASSPPTVHLRHQKTQFTPLLIDQTTETDFVKRRNRRLQTTLTISHQLDSMPSQMTTTLTPQYTESDHN
jgi:hypothetical protein